MHEFFLDFDQLKVLPWLPASISSSLTSVSTKGFFLDFQHRPKALLRQASVSTKVLPWLQRRPGSSLTSASTKDLPWPHLGPKFLHDFIFARLRLFPSPAMFTLGLLILWFYIVANITFTYWWVWLHVVVGVDWYFEFGAKLWFVFVISASLAFSNHSKFFSSKH